MLEALGIVFGGASRLFQHYMDLKDKQAERDHEWRMVDQTIKIQEQQKEIRQIELQSVQDAGELDALSQAIQGQERTATKAGGWVAKLSASVRPVTTYWLLFIYSFVKAFIVSVAVMNNVPFAEAVASSYTEFDGALLGSVMAYWYADRSLRKRE